MRLPRVSLIVGEVDHVDRCHEEYGRATCYARCLTFVAEVVEWQTRTFEGRVAQAVRVQVPPSAPLSDLPLRDQFSSKLLGHPALGFTSHNVRH